MKSLMSLVLVTVTLVLPAGATARTFDVDVCHTPSGKEVGTTGWTPLSETSALRYDILCGDGSFGVATKPGTGPYAHGFFSGWRYAVDGGLKVVGYSSMWRGTSSTWTWYAGVIGRTRSQPGWINLNVCNAPGCGESGWLDEFVPMDEIAIGIGCNESGADCPAGSSASIDVQWMRLRIQDSQVPSLVVTSGTLTSAAPLAGVADVAYRVTDQGSGVTSVSLEVDGRPTAQQTYSRPSSTCKTPFVVPHPCPKSTSGRLAVDTASLLDGVHTVRLVVRDAAGNPGVVTLPNITVANRRIVNLCATQLGSEASTKLTPRKLKFGKSGLLSVTWPTMPWNDADAVLFEGDDVVSLGSKAVRRGDRYIVHVAPGTSRIVRMAFRPLGSTGPYACSAPILAAVRAGVSLRARPKRVMNGRRVVLRGGVSGGPIAGGRSVVIEARAQGGRRRWIPVHVVQTNRRGQFRYVYRFTRTRARARFLFRARLLVERGFPYAAGASDARAVTVVPRRR
jgi:hypothetical protein